MLLNAYNDHLKRGDYKNRTVLEQKIHHQRQNVAFCLALIVDKEYVSNQFKKLKKSGIYPYPFRKAALKTNQPLWLRIAIFLLPITPMFWTLRYFYLKKYKRAK